MTTALRRSLRVSDCQYPIERQRQHNGNDVSADYADGVRAPGYRLLVTDYFGYGRSPGLWKRAMANARHLAGGVALGQNRPIVPRQAKVLGREARERRFAPPAVAIGEYATLPYRFFRSTCSSFMIRAMSATISGCSDARFFRSEMSLVIS